MALEEVGGAQRRRVEAPTHQVHDAVRPARSRTRRGPLGQHATHASRHLRHHHADLRLEIVLHDENLAECGREGSWRQCQVGCAAAC